MATNLSKCDRLSLSYNNKSLELYHGKEKEIDVASYIALIRYNARMFYGESLQNLITVSEDNFNTDMWADNPEQKYSISIQFATMDTFRSINLHGSIINLTADELSEMGIKLN